MAPKSSAGGRLMRMEAQMQRVLAEIIPREVKDPRVGPLTVTQVKLAQDLSYARVFYVPLGGTASAPQVQEGVEATAGSLRGEDFQKGLVSAAGFLRGEVARRVGLRHAPRLEFIADDSFDRAARLTALIDAANKPRDEQ